MNKIEEEHENEVSTDVVRQQADLESNPSSLADSNLYQHTSKITAEFQEEMFQKTYKIYLSFAGDLKCRGVHQK